MPSGCGALRLLRTIAVEDFTDAMNPLWSAMESLAIRRLIDSLGSEARIERSEENVAPALILPAINPL